MIDAPRGRKKGNRRHFAVPHVALTPCPSPRGRGEILPAGPGTREFEEMDGTTDARVVVADHVLATQGGVLIGQFDDLWGQHRADRPRLWHSSGWSADAAGISVVQQCAAGVYFWNVVVGGDFVDLRAEDARPAALNTVKPLDDARMPRLLAPWVGCHAPMTARRPARSSARWSIPPSRAKRPNAWRTTGEPHGPIGVHRRASPCFICGKFLLALPRHKRATRAEAAGDRSLSEPRPACAQPVRITVQGYSSSASPILCQRHDLLATPSVTIVGA